MDKLRGFEKVKWAKEAESFAMPKRATAHSAGYDLTYNGEKKISISPDECSGLIPMGIKAYMQPDEVLFIHVRSSIGNKKGLILANCTGIIDSDYYGNAENDGEIFVNLRNLSGVFQTISPGDRIAQAVFSKYLIADGDDETTERKGGIGSTGV